MSAKTSAPALRTDASHADAGDGAASGSRHRAGSELLDRAMNLLLATAALVLVSPVLVVFAILVKLTSPGPVFYAQARVGLNRRSRAGGLRIHDRRVRDVGGRPFTIYKFRSMRVDAEALTGAVWATRGDPRVTGVGRFMRACRIDELPQFFNVLLGDMSIVGPRPERPGIFARLCDDIAEYPLRQCVRPGITGWAQVNRCYDASLDDVREKVRFDLEYVERQGVAEDLRIMARTVPVMFFHSTGW